MSHYQLTQRVFAVGKPPDDKICFFCRLKNAVLLPVVVVQKKPTDRVFMTRAHLILPYIF